MRRNLDIQEELIRRDYPVQWPEGAELVVAVLIDGENTTPKSIGFIQSRAERLGALRVQHVHGNWSSGSLHGWEQVLSSHRLVPYHHKPVAVGKNATDIALVVDAMQLYSLGMRQFCIYASDSDYTPLIEFLCTQGCLVVVMGKPTTPHSLRRACSVFVDISVTHTSSRLGNDMSFSQVKTASIQMHGSLEGAILPAGSSREQLKAWILEQLSSYEPSPYAWVHVLRFREYLTRSNPTFKPKTYGFKNILVLLQAFPESFELRPYQGKIHEHEVRRVE
jgi:hypothetical protein